MKFNQITLSVILLLLAIIIFTYKLDIIPLNSSENNFTLKLLVKGKKLDPKTQ